MHDIGHLYQYIVMRKDAMLSQHGMATSPEEDMKQLGKVVDAYFCDAYGVTSGQRKHGTFVHSVQRHARMSTRVRWFGILHGYLDARLYQVDLTSSNASVVGAIGLLCNLLRALTSSPEDIGRTFMEKNGTVSGNQLMEQASALLPKDRHGDAAVLELIHRSRDGRIPIEQMHDAILGSYFGLFRKGVVSIALHIIRLVMITNLLHSFIRIPKRPRHQ